MFLRLRLPMVSLAGRRTPCCVSTTAIPAPPASQSPVRSVIVLVAGSRRHSRAPLLTQTAPAPTARSSSVGSRRPARRGERAGLEQPPPQPGGGQVGRHPPHPGGLVLTGADPLPILVGPQEGLLGDVLSPGPGCPTGHRPASRPAGTPQGRSAQSAREAGQTATRRCHWHPGTRRRVGLPASPLGPSTSEASAWQQRTRDRRLTYHGPRSRECADLTRSAISAWSCRRFRATRRQPMRLVISAQKSKASSNPGWGPDTRTTTGSSRNTPPGSLSPRVSNT
jgi:hypothetical protein